ncbi:thiamine pyrophosphate-binding protein [Aspergillus affinis]|uniref:thiamine pyrophosphate-binding protein n=1 Tax=Aspergillus affinis TaxID=1070780 RepID=UPI0022FF43BF|nr:acetolactate synthase [Aspergillus affinis]KAI9043324.1 acetolactate synthase [Aspergillus affinis]
MDTRKFVGLTGGDVVRETVAKYGVHHVFGYPGDAALPLFDAIFKSSLFRLILSHHEQGAGHMAEGYARASGKPGVVLVTSGPGVSNMATPMLDALSDGTPMVVLCGQVSTAAQGTQTFQEIDAETLAKPCTKWCTCVRSISSLPDCLELAFHHAMDGRPGPVLVAIPEDIGLATFDVLAFEESLKSSYNARGNSDPQDSSLAPAYNMNTLYDQIDRVADVINNSERPVICAGNGVHGEHGALFLSKVAEKAQIPVATTLLGLGSYDEIRDKSLHLVGTYGSPYGNYAIQNADLIIAIGARLDERAVGNAAAYAPMARETESGQGRGIIHFDIAPDAVGKVIKPTEVVVGDLSQTLPILLARLVGRKGRSSWLRQIHDWKRQHPFKIPNSDSFSGACRCLPQHVVRELNQQTAPTKHRTTITTGVGQHQIWTTRFYRWRYPRSLITPGSLAPMGFGVPAAIGAQLARPDHQVIDVDGDACFSMTMEELLTASHNRISIKVIILNNDKQGMTRQLQAGCGGHVCYVRQGNPDIVKLARSMNCQSRRCGCLYELPGCIQWLLRCQGPAVLDILTDDTEMIPLVPNGQPLDQMLLEPTGATGP